MNGSVLDNVKKAVRDIVPYTLKQYVYDIKINQNENPLDVPVSLKDEILEIARERSWSRYPPFVAETLREKLAEYTGWCADGILVGNGSNELIQALLAVFLADGDRLVLPAPTFTVYRLVGTVYGADVAEIPLRPDFTYDTDALAGAFLDGGDMIILCSPNNPTGCLFPLDTLESLLEETSKPVIVDEAYCEFSGVTALPLLEKHNNLVILRTFSKAFSLAGLRVGYALMRPELAREVEKGVLPYNLNFFSMAAAEILLDRRAELSDSIDMLISEREPLVAAMNDLEGVTAYPSRANFIMFETPYPPKRVLEALLKDGILIRDVSSYPMLGQALRVSVSTPEDNSRFLDSLAKAVRIFREEQGS